VSFLFFIKAGLTEQVLFATKELIGLLLVANIIKI